MRILLLAHAPSVHTQRWMRALAARGHELRLLSVVTAPHAAAAGEPVGWPGAPWPFLRYASARAAVRRALAEWRPDVTVAHFLPNYGFLAALAGASPFVLVAWGSDLLVNARRTPLHEARARWVLRRAAMIHVDAENLGRAARELGAPAERVWTRPWGVDSAGLAPSAPWRERFERAGTLRLLWTRMLEPIYDAGTFLRALGRLRSAGVPFLATIAGDGPLRAGLEAEASSLGLAGSVRFLGLVDEARLRALYREHEVYVSMSRSDSTSQSLLEAMAAGLATVVSDIPGNEPWVLGTGSSEAPEAPAPEGRAGRARFGDAGILVPRGDDASLAERLAALGADRRTEARVAIGTARVRAEADWGETVARFEEKLRLLAGSAGGGGSGAR
ncbi:MAG TPA: glycosyltransferase [Candidatus Eisenbacteria bacterium]|nr:glycosyltransferase [Candidatus Eisenbacteria bacterium]